MDWSRDDGYEVSDDQARMDLDRIHHWLSTEAYWALDRSRENVATSIRNSITLGCFSPEGIQVGLTRWITDGATFAWICDVFVDPEFRGRGLGEFLLNSAMAHPGVRDVRLFLLATRDAHDLYRRYGFITVPEANRWMELRSSPVATSSLDQALES
jgi:GNAT superfamily N-acetyltransferase